jgi:Domain of unknown function (DUF4307)
VTANDTTRPTLPEGRYGSPPRPWRRLAAIFIVTALAAGAVAWLGWAALHHAHPSVRATLLRYQVTSRSTVEVEFELVKEEGVAAVCVVRARNSAGEEVGRRTVRFPEGGPQRRIVTETLATRDTAILGEVRECQEETDP